LPDVFRDQVRETLALRNHGAHVGMRTFPSDGQQRSHAAAFVRAVNTLLHAPVDEYWGGLAGLADELVAADLDGVTVRVEQLRIRARARLDSIGESLLQKLRQASIDETAALIGPDIVAMDCPTCGAVATAEGELVDEGEPDFDLEDGMAVPYWAYQLNLILDRFNCGVCGFSPSGEDELKAAGIPLSVANPEASPGDLYEPDFDRDGGRARTLIQTRRSRRERTDEPPGVVG
jgi:hypothetical protein